MDREFVEYLIRQLVNKPESVVVTRTVDEMGVLLSVKVDKDDMGLLIGRAGSTAKGNNLEAKKAKTDLPILEKFKNHLNANEIISELELNKDETALANELNLLTAKKFIYTINVSESQLEQKWQPDDKLKAAIGDAPYAVICNTLELSISEMKPEEKNALLKELGLPESGLDKLIKIGYRTLHLLTFLTTGEDETRAWTAHIGDPIPKAARAIHTDFEKLFIRAEVINWQTLLDASSWGKAREHGTLRTVGRDYVINEGDVVEIKI